MLLKESLQSEALVFLHTDENRARKPEVVMAEFAERKVREATTRLNTTIQTLSNELNKQLGSFIYTPTGKQIQEYDVMVEQFKPNDNGDVMTREEWLGCVEDGSFIPYDGTLGEIVIDGILTHYVLKGWNPRASDGLGFAITSNGGLYKVHPISMDEFKNLKGSVLVVWYNR